MNPAINVAGFFRISQNANKLIIYTIFSIIIRKNCRLLMSEEVVHCNK